MAAQREIRSLDDALLWGDEWEQAWRDERRERLRDSEALLAELFDLHTDHVIASGTATLLRAQLKAAGIVPMDEEPQPVEEAAAAYESRGVN
jgi:hypothetical protein